MLPTLNEYQVQEEDKDLATLATRMNTSYQTLKTLNPYITSISTGQIVNVPFSFGQVKMPNQAYGFGAGQPNQGVQQPPIGPQPVQQFRGPYVGQGTYLPAAIPGGPGPSLYGQSEKFGKQPSTTPAGTTLGPQLGETAAAALTATLSNAKSANDLPAFIPMADFNRTGWTLEQALEAGYILSNGMLVKSSAVGGPGAPGGGVLTAQNAPGVSLEQRYAANMAVQKQLMESYRWYKGKYVKVGDLVRQGRLNLRTGRTYDQPMRRNAKGKLVPANRPAAVQTPPSPLETVRPDTPSVTLDLILGT